MKRYLAAIALGCSLSIAVPGAADEATEQYAHAKKLYNDGRHGLALPLFREALEQSGSPNARLFVARCLRETGELVAAYQEFERTLADARRLAETQPKYKPTRDAAAAEIARLEEKVGRVVVALPDGVTDAQVRVGERAVETPSQPTAVLPGPVTVAVEAAGYEPATKSIDVAGGALQTVVVELTPVASAADPTSPAPTPATPDSGGLGTWRTIGIVVAGVGVGGLVMGGVTGAMARSKESQLEEECGGQRCTDASYADVVDSGQTLSLLANVGFFAGGGLVAAGVAMIVFGGPGEDGEQSAGLEPRLVVTPTGAWGGLGGAF